MVTVFDALSRDLCCSRDTEIAIINGYICVQDDDLRKAEILSIKQRKDGLAF